MINRKYKGIPFYFFAALLAFGHANSQTPNNMIASSLDSLFQTYFSDDKPGGAVLLVKSGSIIYQQAFGIADIQTKEKITTKTVFNTGSISKTFVSYGILKLAQEGKLSIDDDLYKYFPDFSNAAIARQVKLFHLLTHTSGLPDSRKVKEENEFYLTAKDEENWAPIKATQELLFAPGSQYQYSNPAFNGLALIIEKVTGIKWQQYISHNIFKPAGMLQSTITDGPHPATGVAHAYVKDGTGKFSELDYGEEPTFAAAGNGGIWSNVEELWKYEKAIHEHRFLSAQTIDLSRRVYPLKEWKEKLPSRLGLSWFIIKDAEQQMIGHTGSQGGFISDYCWYPESGIFYVLLCNTPVPLRELRMKVMALVDKR